VGGGASGWHRVAKLLDEVKEKSLFEEGPEMNLFIYREM